MFRKLSLSLFTILFLVSLTLTSATAARAVSLAELINPDCTICSITVDDKLFTNFTFSVTSTDPNLTTPDDASGINVGGFVVGSEIGLAFTGGMSAQDGATLDLVIGYKVTVLDPDRLISDIELIFNGNASLGSHTSVVETVLDAMPGPGQPALIGEATVQDPPNGQHDQIIDLSRPVRMALVQKDIILQAANLPLLGGNVTISVIDQLFSQTRPPQDIPEPASLLLLGSGLAFIVRSRRRHIG
jgi:hypothetical protein